MVEKYSSASEYDKKSLELIQQACLYVATKLGDLLDDLVVVGGLVPSLLIPESSLEDEEEAHVGTMDLDLGLALAVLNTKRYKDLTERFRRAGFRPDVNEAGNTILQRWQYTQEAGIKITIDFLVPASLPTDKGGSLRHIEPDFAAIITPGLELAFEDRQKVTLKGQTIIGDHAQRDIWVCGPAAFIVLKSLAFDQRGEDKDAYDLYYVVRNYGRGVEDVFRYFEPLLDKEPTRKALDILRRDFSEPISIGPSRVAHFITKSSNDVIQADVAGFIRELLYSFDI